MHEERRPTVPQVYALAGALCARADERFPETRAQASALIERLRRELGARGLAAAVEAGRAQPQARRSKGGWWANGCVIAWTEN